MKANVLPLIDVDIFMIISSFVIGVPVPALSCLRREAEAMAMKNLFHGFCIITSHFKVHDADSTESSQGLSIMPLAFAVTL